MNITEIRTKLVNDPAERLRAYCSITIDEDFVIRDLKVIEGPNGLFLAMPSRKLTDRCPKCGCKNHLRARFCNDCGARLPENRIPRDQQGRSKLHADVAHPITSTCRERIQEAVVEAFSEEFERSQTPGYQPVEYDDYDEYEDDEPEDVIEEETEEEEDDVEVEFFDDDMEDEEDDIEEIEPAPRPSGGRRGQGRSEYDDLIADLRRDATDRGSQRRVGGRDSGGGRERGGRERSAGDRVAGDRGAAGNRERGNSSSGGTGGRRGDARREPPREQPRERTDSRRAAASGASSASSDTQRRNDGQESTGEQPREGGRGRRGRRGGRGGRGRGGRRERGESTTVAETPVRGEDAFFSFDDEPETPVVAATPEPKPTPTPPPVVEAPKPVPPPAAAQPEPVEEEDDFGAGLL